MSNLTRSEVFQDLVNTRTDISVLEDIVDNINLFMTHSGGEDRSAFKTDLVKYKALLEQARRLEFVISKKLTELP